MPFEILILNTYEVILELPLFLQSSEMYAKLLCWGYLLSF